MDTSKPCNLMASLKVSNTGKQGASKCTLTIETEDLFFDPDDKIMAKATAQAMVTQIRDNLSKGLGPAFETLPALKASSMRQREYELEQSNRGGQASDRFVDNEFRHKVRANFERDYNAPRLGRFQPKPSTIRGVVSGMLLQSFSARPNKDGKGVTIFVAAKRGSPRITQTTRPQETMSALQSVLKDVPIWSPAAHGSPAVVSAMKKAARSMLGKNLAEMKRAALRLYKELTKTAAGAANAALELSEDAEG